MRFAILGLLMIVAGPLLAQPSSRTELEKRKQALIQAINATKAELAATKQEGKATMSQLRALQSKLDARQRLIGEINGEMNRIEGNISASSAQVQRLQASLSALQTRYAQSIRYAYRYRRSQTMLAFLFSAKSFNQGLLRLRYMQKLQDMRLAQAAAIRRTQGEINQQIGVLATEKSAKNLLLSAEETQRRQLEAEAAQRAAVVRELKGRESELAAEVAKQQKATRQLDRAIADLIRREIELARRKAAEEAKKQAEIAERRRKEEEARKAAIARAATPPATTPASGTNNGGTYGTGTNRVGLNTGSGTRAAEPSRPGTTATAPRTTPAAPASSGAVASGVPAVAPRKPAARAPVNLNLTPEAAALSASFAANRGRLPWPVERGTVISSFGTHKHPVAERVMVENNGIDIQTAAGAAARAVFDGTVSNVFYIPGVGQNVLINHGEYFTVYTGLSGVSVGKGAAVRTKQVIGTVGTNDEGLPVLNFQVWKGQSKMNPAGWIAQ